MLWVDPGAGGYKIPVKGLPLRPEDNKLLRLLRERGLKAEEKKLPGGDVAFVGRGKRGNPAPVAIEHKGLGDVLACIQSGRFAAVQLPKLQENYAQAWLLVEGIFRPDEQGFLVRWMGGKWMREPLGGSYWRYNALSHWILTQVTRGGIHYWQTGSRAETGQFIHDLYTWWQDGLESHETHLSLRAPQSFVDRVSLSPPTLCRMWAAQLPGVGSKVSKDAARHFKSPRVMACADVEEWTKIPGVGKGKAQKIVQAICHE